jgi:translation initiation factor 2B subunit (eIF-2B alpha/beta/delta family)
MVRGRNIETGKLDTVRITPEGVGSGDEVWQGVYNPSFDVTPAELISESLSSMVGGDADSRLCGYGEGGC